MHARAPSSHTSVHVALALAALSFALAACARGSVEEAAAPAQANVASSLRAAPKPGAPAPATFSSPSPSTAAPPAAPAAPASPVKATLSAASASDASDASDAGATDEPAIDPALLSPALRGDKLHSPMPGGYLGGWYGDTGLDIAGNHLPVYAIAAGTLEYSENGHTLWTGKGDTPGSVRIRLDEPIPYKGHHVTHVYYTHMSALVTEQREGSAHAKHVVAGEPIGVSGVGNGVPHLHLGLLLDSEVEQDSWAFILREGDVRAVMGGYKNGELLPMKKK